MAITEAPRAALSPQTSTAAPVSVFSLAGFEVRAGLRGAAFKFAAALALVVGFAVGGQPGRGASLSAWTVGEAAWQYLAFIVIVWMGIAAVYDSVSRTDRLIYSKPQTTERLVLSRFLAGYAQILIALAAMFLGAILSRLYSGGGLGGFPIYGIRFAASAGVLFFTAAASYSLALLARTPLAGAIVALYWVMTQAGKGFLAKPFFPAYTQNLTIYVPLGIAFVCVACWMYRRQRRGAARPALWVRIVAPLTLWVSAWALYYNMATGHDPHARTQPALDMMAEQNATMDTPAPGFRLPDASGRLTSLADYPDRILVIALWSPKEPESVYALAALDDIRERYGNRGVQPIAVCLSEDTYAASEFARGEGVQVPVVEDWGTHNAEKASDVSPMATAYQVSLLPHVVITDRRRNIREVLNGLDGVNRALLDRAIQARLAAEPE